MFDVKNFKFENSKMIYYKMAFRFADFFSRYSIFNKRTLSVCVYKMKSTLLKL